MSHLVPSLPEQKERLRELRGPSNRGPKRKSAQATRHPRGGPSLRATPSCVGGRAMRGGVTTPRLAVDEGFKLLSDGS
eukprot:6128829-Pyramimonas_sp.AAC.1